MGGLEEPTSQDELTWLPEPTSLQQELTSLDGSTQLPVDTSRRVNLAARADMSRRSALPPETIRLDGWTWLPEQTSIDGLTRPSELRARAKKSRGST